MAQFYQVLKADPLGDPYTPNFAGAKPTQTYWCQLEGVDKDVSIGKQVGNTLTPGQHVYGELVYAKSQKGTEYWKFKSVKVPDGVQRPASSPAQAQAQQATGVQDFTNKWSEEVGGQVPGWAIPLYNMVTYIYDEMKKMEAVDTGSTSLDEVKIKEPSERVEELPLGAEPLDAETQATIDSIFSGDPVEDEDATE